MYARPLATRCRFCSVFARRGASPSVAASRPAKMLAPCSRSTRSTRSARSFSRRVPLARLPSPFPFRGCYSLSLSDTPLTAESRARSPYPSSVHRCRPVTERGREPSRRVFSCRGLRTPIIARTRLVNSPAMTCFLAA